MKNQIYENGALFYHGIPRLKLFYVTMGKWEEPEVIVHRMEQERALLEGAEKFETVAIDVFGAKQLRELYFRPKKPVEREFTLKQKVTLPPIPGITQAYLGIIPASDYIELLEDDSGRCTRVCSLTTYGIFE